MKVWTMGPLLAGRVDCSEGAIIHQLLVSQPSVQYMADPQNGCGAFEFNCIFSTVKASIVDVDVIKV